VQGREGGWGEREIETKKGCKAGVSPLEPSSSGPESHDSAKEAEARR
jgi:hypothetical protein